MAVLMLHDFHKHFFLQLAKHVGFQWEKSAFLVGKLLAGNSSLLSFLTFFCKLQKGRGNDCGPKTFLTPMKKKKKSPIEMHQRPAEFLKKQM